MKFFPDNILTYGFEYTKTVKLIKASENISYSDHLPVLVKFRFPTRLNIGLNIDSIIESPNKKNINYLQKMNGGMNNIYLISSLNKKIVNNFIKENNLNITNKTNGSYVFDKFYSDSANGLKNNFNNSKNMYFILNNFK
jgi:hypothetical protein